MSKKLNNEQKNRAAALKEVLDLLNSAYPDETFLPEEVLTYAKFILGPGRRAAARKDALEMMGLEDPEPEPDATSSAPIGEDPGDADVLRTWTEAIKARNAEQERDLEAAALEAEPEVGETNDSAGAAEWLADDGRPSWDARPEVRNVTLTPASALGDKRIAEEVMGLVPGALDEELTITNEGTFLPDGSPAEKALRKDLSASWAPRWHVPEASTNAPDHVVAQGASLGCPECSAEAERREKRDEAKEEGRRKLAERLDATTGRSGDLDEDELLAVAGSELYPAGDEEPSRELRIRNRKGEVWKWAEDASGWTSTPEDPWRLHCQWTSSEMVRRGPWHVV